MQVLLTITARMFMAGLATVAISLLPKLVDTKLRSERVFNRKMVDYQH
jgi:hypothetical protein